MTYAEMRDKVAEAMNKGDVEELERLHNLDGRWYDDIIEELNPFEDRICRFVVNKYCGRKYCGNAFFDTYDECIAFANDGFCDRAVIRNTETMDKQTVRLDAEWR